MLGDLGKLIVAKGFKKLPKVQKIARSGHTGCKFKPETFLLFTVIFLLHHLFVDGTFKSQVMLVKAE